MATVPNFSTTRKPQGITHYAYLGDLYGTAELLNGTGYLFREEGQRQATLVSYKDPELMLLGLVELSEMQRELDDLLGGPAAVRASRRVSPIAGMATLSNAGRPGAPRLGRAGALDRRGGELRVQRVLLHQGAGALGQRVARSGILAGVAACGLG